MGWGITGQSSSTSSQTNISNDSSQDNSATDNKVSADGGASVLSTSGGALSITNTGVPENLNFAGGVVDTAFKTIGEAASKIGSNAGGGGYGAPVQLPAAVGGGSLPGWLLPVGILAALGITFYALKGK